MTSKISGMPCSRSSWATTAALSALAVATPRRYPAVLLRLTLPDDLPSSSRSSTPWPRSPEAPERPEEFAPGLSPELAELVLQASKMKF